MKCHEYACKSIVKIVCDYYNNSNITTSELCDMYNLSSTAILSYLKKGNQIGWCSYNPIEQRNKGLNIGRIISKKPVEIFKDNKSLGKFKSLTDLSKKSLMLFGIKLDADEISKVCRKIRSDYKGFIFKFI